MWYPNGISIQLDTTTHCNAKCPQCHRTNPNGLGKIDDLPLIHWTLNDFKKAFSDNDLNMINWLTFCPTWGDAMMSNHTKDIVEYVFSVNPLITISIETNGSMRNEDWWWEFGLLSKGGKHKLKVTFDIDGINQSMHETYRQGTDLQKVLNNMKAFSESRSTTAAQTIMFKHNEDYKEEITELVKANGADFHKMVVSDRFYGSKIYKKDNGELITLEPVTKKLENSTVSISGRKEFTSEIKCGWAEQNNISISFDGQVHPCCYFGNPYITHNILNQERTKFIEHPLIKDYTNSNLNIFKSNLTDILNHEWYKKKLPESWTTDNPVHQCSSHCSNKIGTPNKARSIIPINSI